MALLFYIGLSYNDKFISTYGYNITMECDVNMRKEIVVLNEEVEKDWQDVAQQWCDIGREQDRHIYVIHNNPIHIVCEEVD